jgi:hypothetical protein
MVDLRGFEPLTSSMPWRRAPSYATGPFDLVPGSVIDIHSLYAITGVPASIRHLTVPGTIDVSHLLLSGEFCPALQPCTNRLLSAKGGRTTPVHRLLYEFGRGKPALRTIPHAFAICKAVKQYSDGGDEGARTPDLDSAIVALSQLSYIPWYGR